MNEITRKKMVVAMEFVARQISDESIFDTWLSYGVADGDIEIGSLEFEKVPEYYLDDMNFQDLMETFLARMHSAYLYNGIDCDGVSTDL